MSGKYEKLIKKSQIWNSSRSQPLDKRLNELQLYYLAEGRVLKCLWNTLKISWPVRNLNYLVLRPDQRKD